MISNNNDTVLNQALMYWLHCIDWRCKTSI